jgi:putative flippase GtrA
MSLERFLPQSLRKYKIYVKFVLAGGTAAGTNLALLFFFTDILGIYYLISTTLSFIIAYFVSFYLQKYWTFRDNSRDKMAKQMSLYFIVGATNLGINDTGMYLLVDKAHLHHLIAQVVMGGIIAISSFLIYKFFIFKEQEGDGINGKEKT